MGKKGITAWTGAAFDKRRQRLLVSGGGHNDYGGNEVYAFSLMDLKWLRLTDPIAFLIDIQNTTMRMVLRYPDIHIED